ncbi:MAG: aspartate aminotransferase family protein [Anaerolineae bacterium]|jgi:glutamate/tyrosine decarboxylase-like PLP-dependent enzyme|nr:MAG: aspartate aminotransferase family protein [Anaerolineae bacterium]
MQIPEQGLSQAQIFEYLNLAKSYDMNWQDGRMYAYVYDPGQAAMEIGRQAYMTYLVENGLDPTAFPSVLKLENDVVRMVINLLHGDENVVGNLTTGGTESILLAVKTARDWARVHKPHIREPEIVLCQTAHHAFHKAAHYFGLKVVLTPFDPTTFRLDLEAMRKAITPNTILLVGSAPAYSQGVVDPIPELAALAQEHDLLCHVDACVGGIHLSFMRQLGYDVPPFDWTVPGVTSISTDLHKFGYCPKPASVVMYRNAELRRFQIFTSTRTTCYTLINPTILSTKSGGPAAAAWAVLNFLGQEGYRQIVAAVQEATARMIAGVNAMPGLEVMGKPDMCLFAFTSDRYNLFQVVDAMAKRGWTVQPQFAKPGAPRNIHISVNYGNVKRVEEFLQALQESVTEVSVKPPIQSEPLIAELKRLIEQQDPQLFQKAAALVGMQDGNLPKEMALVNTLLEAMPDEIQAQFLVEFFNQLYR